ncbi:MAG TPA: response regulator [Dissulfurispiraceae bacterium]|nr:response regulator [Dissulfurispiraceae bacterium]
MARILIADDSLTVAKYVETVLKAEGHSLTMATDGVEAIERIKSDHFDLLILDVVMPRKNGYQVCREIKGNEQYKAIPVIMLTTKGLNHDKYWGFRQGANEYLTKPCSPEDLVGAVNKHIVTEAPSDYKRATDPLLKEKPVFTAPSRPVFYRFNS